MPHTSDKTIQYQLSGYLWLPAEATIFRNSAYYFYDTLTNISSLIGGGPSSGLSDKHSPDCSVVLVVQFSKLSFSYALTFTFLKA